MIALENCLKRKTVMYDYGLESYVSVGNYSMYLYIGGDTQMLNSSLIG